MPSTPEGEHLLAHEVAHTVQQQGGIKRLQLKSLAVSQPTDSHEVEADRAADAMVAGKQASVADAPIGLHRKTGDAEVDVMSGDASVDVGEVKKEVSLGPIKLTPSLSGSVKLKNKNVSAPETAGPGGISTNVSATKDSVKLSAEKEVGPENWTIKPKLSGDIKADKNGVTFGFGVSVSHPGFSFQNLHAGPFSIEGKIVEWEVGKTPKFLCVTPSAKLSADVPGTYMGYQVTPELTFACDIEPNWVEMAKYLAEAVAAAADTAAFAIAAPLGTGIVMLVGWAKAGHEFDEVQQRIEGMRARCKLATREAMTGVHYSWGLPGGGDMNADTSAVAAQIRTIVAQQAGIPEGAFPDIAKAKPAIADKLYQAAWKQLWYGDLKPKLVAAYQDTTFTSYKFERMWLDTFDTGDFSKG